MFTFQTFRELGEFCEKCMKDNSYNFARWFAKNHPAEFKRLSEQHVEKHRQNDLIKQNDTTSKYRLTFVWKDGTTEERIFLNLNKTAKEDAHNFLQNDSRRFAADHVYFKWIE